MKRTPRPALSGLFLAVSVALFAAGGFLYFQDREDEETVEIPIAAAGENELVHVVSVLEAEGIEVAYLTGADGAGSRMLENNAGQPLTADGERLYVFIYPDVETRELATLDVLPEDVDLRNNAGDPVAAADLRLFSASNVAAVLVGGDGELAEKIAVGLERLA